MLNLIEKYIEEHTLAWSESTKRSEKYRLHKLADILDGNPERLWEALKEKSPYTKLTTWIRVVKFWEWLLLNNYKDGNNAYDSFKKKNSRIFKNVYVRRSPRITFNEAYQRIRNINDLQSRKKAEELLKTGMRFSESLTLQDGWVYGKGGKSRRIYGGDFERNTYTKSYDNFRRQLRRVGLKPHDLRKICFNNLVSKNVNEFELCAIAGWSNINTASSYIKLDEKRLEKLME